MDNGIRFYFDADRSEPMVMEWIAGEPWPSHMYVLGAWSGGQIDSLGNDWEQLLRTLDGIPVAPPPAPWPFVKDPRVRRRLQ
jgi:hypothetical protein